MDLFEGQFEECSLEEKISMRVLFFGRVVWIFQALIFRNFLICAKTRTHSSQEDRIKVINKLWSSPSIFNEVYLVWVSSSPCIRSSFCGEVLGMSNWINKMHKTSSFSQQKDLQPLHAHFELQKTPRTSQKSHTISDPSLFTSNSIPRSPFLQHYHSLH